MLVEPVGAAADVRLDDAVLINPQIVDVLDDGDLQALLDGLEVGVALEQLEREIDALVEEVLIVLAEETDAGRPHGTEPRGRRQRARFGQGVGDPGEDEEQVVVAAEGEVAL